MKAISKTFLIVSLWVTLTLFCAGVSFCFLKAQAAAGPANKTEIPLVIVQAATPQLSQPEHHPTTPEAASDQPASEVSIAPINTEESKPDIEFNLLKSYETLPIPVTVYSDVAELPLGENGELILEPITQYLFDFDLSTYAEDDKIDTLWLNGVHSWRLTSSETGSLSIAIEKYDSSGSLQKVATFDLPLQATNAAPEIYLGQPCEKFIAIVNETLGPAPENHLYFIISVSEVDEFSHDDRRSTHGYKAFAAENSSLALHYRFSDEAYREYLLLLQ